jgi:ribonuclease P protein component
VRPAGSHALRATSRLKTQRHFRAVYARGRRASGAWMTVVALAHRPGAGRPAPDNVRVGLSVSKDHGGAVRRNKLKRLLREAFRLERNGLPRGVDLVLIPKQRPDDFPLAALRDELVSLVRRALQGGGNGGGRARGAPRGEGRKEPRP